MLRKAMTVLALFSAERREIGVIEAAELLAASKSTVSRWLSGMEDAGLLSRDGDAGRYRLSMRLAALGELARQATSLQRLSRPALERLTASTGETSNLVILEDGEAVNVDVVESPRPLKHVGWLGRRLPKHATASGKTLLAWRSRDEVLSLLELPLRKFTHTTITEVDALLEQLAEIRRVGYSVAWKEFEEDLVGIAAPVRDFTGGVVGVLTIGAPISRVALTMVPALGLKVVAVADAVSKDLGYLAATARALGSSALRGSVEDPA